MFPLLRQLVQGGRMRPGVHGWGRGIMDERAWSWSAPGLGSGEGCRAGWRQTGAAPALWRGWSATGE